MTIGIYESEHFETVYPVLRVLGIETNQITVYTTVSVAKQLKDQLGADSTKINWVLKETTQSVRSFISTIALHAKQQSFDIFLLNTVSNNHLFFARMIDAIPATSFYLVVHDVNNLIKSKPALGFRKLIRHIGKMRLLKKCKGFFTISSRTTEYMAGFIKDGRYVQWFPGAVFEEENYRIQKIDMDSPIRIVVPGSLDSRRRNYEDVFKLMDLATARKLAIEICLLGGHSGKDSAAILDKCRLYSKTNSGFTFFDLPEVPFNVFNNQMNSAHFIWVPSTITTVMADNIAETYGQSKSSGNMFDAIRYARPLMVPSALTIDKEQEKAAFVYKNLDDLVEFLSGVLNHPDGYFNWASKALEVSRNYSVSKLQEKAVHYFSK
jgi:hypothetical protein